MTGSYGTLIETLRFGLDSVSWLEVELAAFLCSAAAALASARTTTRELGHDCAFAGVAASEAQGMAGKAIAGGLCDAAASISPYEDVRGYLQQTVLPALGPAIEDLLHQVHSSGELQRVLRKETEAERKVVRKPSEIQVEDPPEKKQSSSGSRKPSLTAGEGSQILRRFSNASELDKAPQAPPPPAPDAAEESRFDPLVWLSDCLKQSASGDASFREQIRERVIQQIKAAEAAEEAERARAEAEAAAARVDDGEITTIAEGASESGNDQARTQLYVFSHCSASSLAFQRCRSPSQKSLPCRMEAYGVASGGCLWRAIAQGSTTASVPPGRRPGSCWCCFCPRRRRLWRPAGTSRGDAPREVRGRIPCPWSCRIWRKVSEMLQPAWRSTTLRRCSRPGSSPPDWSRPSPSPLSSAHPQPPPQNWGLSPSPRSWRHPCPFPQSWGQLQVCRYHPRPAPRIQGHPSPFPLSRGHRAQRCQAWLRFALKDQACCTMTMRTGNLTEAIRRASHGSRRSLMSSSGLKPRNGKEYAALLGTTRNAFIMLRNEALWVGPWLEAEVVMDSDGSGGGPSCSGSPLSISSCSVQVMLLLPDVLASQTKVSKIVRTSIHRLSTDGDLCICHDSHRLTPPKDRAWLEGKMEPQRAFTTISASARSRSSTNSAWASWTS
eukprot:s462_g38.t3